MKSTYGHTTLDSWLAWKQRMECPRPVNGVGENLAEMAKDNDGIKRRNCLTIVPSPQHRSESRRRGTFKVVSKVRVVFGSVDHGNGVHGLAHPSQPFQDRQGWYTVEVFLLISVI